MLILLSRPLARTSLHNVRILALQYDIKKSVGQADADLLQPTQLSVTIDIAYVVEKRSRFLAIYVHNISKL